MPLNISTTVKPNTPRLMRWKKILTVLQAANGAARNKPQPGDALRITRVKCLRSLNNSLGA